MDKTDVFLACTFTGAMQTGVQITASLIVDGKIVANMTVSGNTGVAMWNLALINMYLYATQVGDSLNIQVFIF